MNRYTETAIRSAIDKIIGQLAGVNDIAAAEKCLVAAVLTKQVCELHANQISAEYGLALEWVEGRRMIYQIQQKSGVSFTVESPRTVEQMIVQEKNLGTGLAYMWTLSPDRRRWSLVFDYTAEQLENSKQG